MSERKSSTGNQQSKIQCLEVLIPKNFIAKGGHNLHWTLSVYSLENQPVRKNRAIHNSEIFHFMVYDWNKTIKQLLEDHKIPYSIIQYFNPKTIYSDVVQDDFCLADVETDFLSALEALPDLASDMPGVMNNLSVQVGTTEAHELVVQERRRQALSH